MQYTTLFLDLDNTLLDFYKAEYYAIKSENFVENTFEGSLPAFIAAFTKRKKLSEEEIVQIKSIIDKYGEE